MYFLCDRGDRLRADHLIFEGGWKISKKISCNPKRKKTNHAAYNREKKYHVTRAQKKIPTCKSTDALLSTALQDFAFLSRHICLR
jgi:hypothetical protein